VPRDTILHLNRHAIFVLRSHLQYGDSHRTARLDFHATGIPQQCASIEIITPLQLTEDTPRDFLAGHPLIAVSKLSIDSTPSLKLVRGLRTLVVDFTLAALEPSVLLVTFTALFGRPPPIGGGHFLGRPLVTFLIGMKNFAIPRGVSVLPPHCAAPIASGNCHVSAPTDWSRS
jgi:hypothetical protein